VRKGTDTPYIVHPFAVGLRLSQLAFPGPVVTAGFLHDTLEDCGITVGMLESEFGVEIAALVSACSEPDKSLPWHERKQHTIDALAAAPWQVKAVVAADKLDNLRAMATDFSRVGAVLWGRFKQGREQQEWYYRSVFRSLVGIPLDAPQSYKALLGELDDTIESSLKGLAAPVASHSIGRPARPPVPPKHGHTLSWIRKPPQPTWSNSRLTRVRWLWRATKTFSRLAWRSKAMTASFPAVTGRPCRCPARVNTTASIAPIGSSGDKRALYVSVSSDSLPRI